MDSVDMLLAQAYTEAIDESMIQKARHEREKPQKTSVSKNPHDNQLDEFETADLIDSPPFLK